MPVKLAKVRLNPAGFGSVELDGYVVPGVRAIAVETEIQNLPVIRLEIVAREVDLRQGKEATDAAP